MVYQTNLTMKNILTFTSILIIGINSFAQNETGTFIDSRDGYSYNTVKIGKQIWLAENLNYRNDYRSYFYNFDSSHYYMYGRLYDFETAKHVCHTGWHLPSETEWIALLNFLGGIKVAAEEMKSGGFSARLGGGFSYTNSEQTINYHPGLAEHKFYSGDIMKNVYYLGSLGCWWSIDVNREALKVMIANKSKKVAIQKHHDKNYSWFYSVRCLKD